MDWVRERLGAGWESLRDEWPTIVSTLGQIGMAIFGVVLGLGRPSEAIVWWPFDPWATFFASIVASIVGGFALRWQAVRLSQVEKERSEAQADAEDSRASLFTLVEDYSQICAHQLSELANSSSLGFGFSERISVYKHAGSAFVMTGRYSKDADYNKRGRVVYPDNEGCIGKAWHEGSVFVSNLPDPETEPQIYVRRLETDWNMPADVTRGLRMKSRCLAAFAIYDPRGDRPMAVIVFESTRTDVLLFDRLQKMMANREGKRLQRFIDVTKPVEPSLIYASQEGF